MPERIYASDKAGMLMPLEETPFSQEDELQVLIADHPELIDGEQINPDDPRRWILVTSEKGVAEKKGEGRRWSVDILLVDQDAVPTLVEVKRGDNPEVRRAIVGQLLEYAAHASRTWSAGELRDEFERNAAATNRDPQEELAALLASNDDPNADEFWDDVSTKLAAKRLRLLFVSDSIPDPLARIVEFLNSETVNTEVLAMEVKQFKGQKGQTLVPRVIGRVSATPLRNRPNAKTTRESFLGGINNESVRCVAERMMNAAVEEGGEIEFGAVGLSIRVKCSLWQTPISVAWLYPVKGQFWYRTREFSFGVAILDEGGLPESLRTTLESWAKEFESDAWVQDVSSSGVQAWAINHELAVELQDILVERLRKVIRTVVAL